jgi:hypothetical protein
MDSTIWTYLVFGAVFGLATYSNRHLFGEGPSPRSNADPVDGLQGRPYWLMVSIWLWPVLTLACIYGTWRRSVARKREALVQDR